MCIGNFEYRPFFFFFSSLSEVFSTFYIFSWLAKIQTITNLGSWGWREKEQGTASIAAAILVRNSIILVICKYLWGNVWAALSRFEHFEVFCMYALCFCLFRGISGFLPELFFAELSRNLLSLCVCLFG